MKLVLFELGDTLESGGVLLPGVCEALRTIGSVRAGGRPAVVLGLVSDSAIPDTPSEVPALRQRYCKLLDTLGIRPFFEPVAERVTLSAEARGVVPDEAIFRAAIGKVSPALDWDDVVFITGNPGHVLAARRLGLRAVLVGGPGRPQGEAETLPELVPLLQAFIEGGEPAETVVLELPPDADDTFMQRLTASEVTWTRLGNVLLVRADATRTRQIRTGSETALSPRRVFVPEGRLHLVTQTARLFQTDYPDVRVIVDKGRYLVVDLDAGIAPLVGGAHASCYTVCPLPANTVVFDQHAARPAALSSRATGADVLPDGLSRAGFEDDVGKLARLRTRHSRSPEFLGALQWAEARLMDLGYATRIQAVAVPGGTSRNLIADCPGQGQDRELVLVTAHLDSVNVRGPRAAAPGADDNASGSAGVLAIGQALAGRSSRHDLRLILFGGEEQGLFGSRHYVSGLDPAERVRISAVVNMDMIACRNTSDAAVLLEGAAVSQPLMDALAGIARAHTSLAVQTSLIPFNSDHVPFLDAGIPAVLTIEGTDTANDRVHTERDTTATLDFTLALEILRMNALFVAQALDTDSRIATPNM